MTQSAKKLTVPRATRVDEDIARPLVEIEVDEDLHGAQVDRLILSWFARKVAGRRRPGQGLKRFLDSIRFEPA